ncbi:phosphopyruvate hydratase [Candidatus Roizmanbacteria bacterium RIFOXYB2_FULL_38_10]|uniref:Enolase n=1 Tax=Candidatus Roizmanbacteria bacterium RIFOXYD1_FULL_38_12 TaxID=1802093 RepID=A0A1F7KZM1_9BACT|nr:MAG: phosphopyruvate hydratase [Candidatus Roizmanbacteria bacterium RIFOXYA2_FULL_38_14]OGK63278.1 MAG: phosphopyruvate hydratase [Candidatus Roizmanbacteria bacterium RIFOXYA1_FULL_37_12]OGK65124.1 MAG: phosphopyruvate hydratase [Candidatus Roizmanbacteria bacterium RIFOXYB1_FULL_40_23]OGK68679.1 MAG: phosphopyruvate hydratase [Candidatus Roizmanbacteria bacterium RIFOXYB2_FULL_38_10]OGK69528.1 MAG: phosphopyruvate hydratase [Candidatus Roizmanbacteria bacterium RIFOXYC1_FULL_38_14]OGK726
MKIKSVRASEILDSRSNPTIECVTILEDGSTGWAAVPSGASTGKYEAVELRDGDKARYGGGGVLKAVSNVNEQINKAVVGLDAFDQRKLDNTMIELDGTENKASLGANAILSVSLSAAKAQAQSEKKPLYQYLSKFNPDHKGIFTMPIPEMNVMNGGKHGNWSTDIQEYMLFPIGAPSVVEAVRMNAEVYTQLKKLLKSKGYSIAVGDEGGFAPNFGSNEEPFQLMGDAVVKAGYILGKDICFGIDPAATEFYKEGKYVLNKEAKTVTSDELADFFRNLASKYPIISMEDIFAEDDWDGFKKYTEISQHKTQIVGDDLYVTNVKRLERGIKEKTTNSILIKLNQIGTISETVDAILMARQNGMTSVVSHRSGETEDAFIADFVVALGTGQIKTGAPARSERNAKYNQLMRIERELGEKAVYAKFPFV